MAAGMPSVTDPRQYVRRALDAECEIAASTSHGRNDQLNRSAFAVGQLVGGHLDRAEAERRLFEAASANGYVAKDGQAAAIATIASGLDKGMREPRDLPANGNRHPAVRDATRPKAGARREGVPLPNWTEPDAAGKPKFFAIGQDLPPAHDDDLRRHVYRRDGHAARVKVKKATGSPAWIDYYHVRRPSDGATGWQAKKPTGFVSVPYAGPADATDPFATSDILVWAEGEKDVDALRQGGLAAFTFGSASDIPDCADLLRGRDLIVTGDNDTAGEKGIRGKVTLALPAAARVRVVRFADLPAGGDVSDFLAGGGTIADFLARAEPAEAEQADDRPVIRIVAGDIARIVDEAEAALIARGGLYQRANQIVFLGDAPVITAAGREIGAQRIFERGEHALAEDLACAARVERFDGRSKDWTVMNPPSWVVKTLRERTGRLRFPVLAGVIAAPTLRADGSLLSEPGYDATTGLFLDPRGAVFPPIRPEPTRDHAERALAALDDLIEKFPFVSQTDRSVALSGILTAVVRQSLATAPLHAFGAPVPGSGKSKLVDIASAIATGREAGVIAQGKTEEETEKRLGALFRAGDPVIAIDNCEAPIGGEFLCQVLSQTTVRVRILGLSEAPEFPTRAFIAATGNGIAIAGDMTRRTLVCQLDPRMERPELRTFEFEPVARAKAERGRYAAAALTILLAYIKAGRPAQAAPLGSFEEWSSLVRNALLWLGRADPVTSMEHARASDPRLDELGQVITQWKAVVGTDRVSVRKLIERATEQRSTGFDLGRAEFVHPDFREALLAVAGMGGAINSKRLGKWINSHVKRIVGGTFIDQLGQVEGVMTYRLSGSTSNNLGADRARTHF